MVGYLRTSREASAELVSESGVVHHVRGRSHDGQARESAIADVLTVEYGRVVRMQVYPDPSEALAG